MIAYFFKGQGFFYKNRGKCANSSYVDIKRVGIEINTKQFHTLVQ